VIQVKQGGFNVGSIFYPAAGGSYTITDIPADSGYTIEVDLSGYITGTITAFTVAGNIIGKNITLVKNPLIQSAGQSHLPILTWAAQLLVYIRTAVLFAVHLQPAVGFISLQVYRFYINNCFYI
jgi:hypothetical protein